MFKKEKTKQKTEYKNVHTRNKGITLIALVITIIVLLILAGVSINILIGENGLLTKSQDAANENTRGGARDKVATSVYASYNTDYNPDNLKLKIDEEALKTNIEKEGGKVLSAGGFPVIVEMDGYKFTIEGEGSITDIEMPSASGTTKWAQSGTIIIGSDGTILNVGDKILNYDPKAGATKQEEISYGIDNGHADVTYSINDFTGGWVVLGVDKQSGQLMITTDDIIVTGEGQGLGLEGAIGYVKVEGELKKISQLYGQGEFADTEKTRGINVEDINQVTGYDPTKDTANMGKMNQYGNVVTYSWNGDVIQYHSNIKSSETSSWSKFQYINDDGSVSDLAQNESKEFQAKVYIYYPNSLTDDKSGETVGKVTEGTKAYKAIFQDTSETNVIYWLSSRGIKTAEGYITYVLGVVQSGAVYLSGVAFRSGSGASSPEARCTSSCCSRIWS